MPSLGDATSHWYILIDGLRCSTNQFYAELDQALTDWALPRATVSRVEHLEGPILGPKCVYFRVRRDEQHKYLQGLIKQGAEAKGYCATIEAHVGEAGRADVLLERGEGRIAVEISITTGADHELANIRKCLAAGATQVAQSDRKDDRIDARMLAKVERLDPSLLHPVHTRSAAAEIELAVLRSRDVLVEAGTKLVNSVRGQVKRTGRRFPRISTDVFGRKAFEQVPDEIRAVLESVLGAIAEMTARIHDYDAQIERRYEKHRETKRLRHRPHRAHPECGWKPGLG